MNSSGKVLILGASGGIGGEVARRLVADNWQVRALKRGAQMRDPEDGIQWIAGDALDGGRGRGGGCRLRRHRPCGESAGLPALAATGTAHAAQHPAGCRTAAGACSPARHGLQLWTGCLSADC